MTALEKYVRLEAEALWREGPAAEPRAVIVSFGKGSLVISDISDAPLTHWSLAATRIVSQDGETVLYAPDGGVQETLAVTDPFLVEAIREVTASVLADQGRPRRRRGLWLLAGLAAAALGAAFWLPGQVPGWVAGLVSDEQKVLVSDEIADRMALQTCAEPRALEAWDRLAALVLMPGDAVRIADLPGPGIAVLPDGRAILDKDLLARAGSAPAFAGWMALAANLPRDRDALDRLIAEADTSRALRLAFTGGISEDEMEAMAARTLAEPVVPTPASVEAALGRLRAAGIAVSPLRESLNLPGEREIGPFIRPLTGQDWAALQRICDR